MSSKVIKSGGENQPSTSTGIKKFFTVSEKPAASQFSSNFITGEGTSDTVVGPSSHNKPSLTVLKTTDTSTQSNLDTGSQPSSMNKFDIAHYRDMVKGMSNR